MQQKWENPKTKQKGAPHVLAVFEHANKICNWVATAIVSESHKKTRAAVVIKMIQLADVRVNNTHFFVILQVLPPVEQFERFSGNNFRVAVTLCRQTQKDMGGKHSYSVL